ncbi:MAG: CapA family protein [bacterium]|nr:CapA family protein [bacterium]
MMKRHIFITACTLFLTGCTFQNQKNTEAAPTPEPPVIVYQTEDYLDAQNAPDPTPTPEPVRETVYDPVNKIYTKETANPELVTLAFGGDICFYDDFSNMTALRSRENGIYDCITEELMTEMQKADILMLNNEFPYSDRGTPTAEKTYTFRAKPENVKILTQMGVDVVSLANNHAFDYGAEALEDSVDILNEEKIPFVGAGKNLEEAMKPVYFLVNDQKLAVVSATQIERLDHPDTKEATETTPGVLRTLNPEKFVKVIEEAEQNSDFVIVYVHWGSENTDLVEASQRDLAAAYVEAGADLIIGDHSHCLQGIDYIDEVPVFYSLGNFWFNSKTLDTCLIRVTLDSEHRIQRLNFLPCIQQDFTTRIADASDKNRIISYMQGISNYALIDQDGNVTKAGTDQNKQNGQNTSPAKKVEMPVDLTTVLPESSAPKESIQHTEN